jgi:hypothetical protein
MPTTDQHEAEDQEKSRVWRAVIYLCKDAVEEMQPLDDVPSIDRQRLLCRDTAAVLHAEVIGEFADRQFIGFRLALHEVLELARKDPQLDYLIVASRDRLTADPNEAFEIAWRLGFAGTVIVPADAGHKFPWTGATHPDQA